jgi:hypothetical protein
MTSTHPPNRLADGWYEAKIILSFILFADYKPGVDCYARQRVLRQKLPETRFDMNNILFSDLSQLQITQHAALRMAQRNVSHHDVHFVMRHGQKLHRAGAIIFFLRQRDIPQEKRSDKKVARLEGTAVITNRCFSTILTVYRNRRGGLQHIKQKPRRTRVH